MRFSTVGSVTVVMILVLSVLTVRQVAMNLHHGRWLGTLSALFSAMLFGLSAPFRKLLLSQIQPLPHAASFIFVSFAGHFGMLLGRAAIKGWRYRGDAPAPW